MHVPEYRFDVVSMEGEDQVIYRGVHHKNSTRRGQMSIEYVIPEGPLRDGLLVYIKKGHASLIKELCEGEMQPYLFMTAEGNAFGDDVFTQWWGMVLNAKWCPGLPRYRPYFPPSTGRNLYVEYVTACTGYAPDEWEAPARAMGNSSAAWCKHYAVTLNSRLVQRGVDWHKEVLMAPAGHGGASTSSAPPPATNPGAAITAARAMVLPPPRVMGSGSRQAAAAPSKLNVEVVDLTMDVSSDDEQCD